MVLFLCTQLFVFWVAFLVAWDICTRKLPDHLTLPGAGLIGIWALMVEPWFLLGGVGWFLLYLLSAVVTGGLGGGDIKFALGLGTVAAAGGVQSWLFAVLGASLLTLLLAVVSAIFRRCLRTAQPGDGRVPHGPGMGFATCGALMLVNLL